MDIERFISRKYISEITSQNIIWPCFNIFISQNLLTYYHFVLDTTLVFINPDIYMYISVFVYRYTHIIYLYLSLYIMSIIKFYNVRPIYFFCHYTENFTFVWENSVIFSNYFLNT